MSLNRLETRKNPITFSKAEFEEVFHRCRYFRGTHRETFQQHGSGFLRHLKGVLFEEGINDLGDFLNDNPSIAEKLVSLAGYKAGQRGVKRRLIEEPGKMMLGSEARDAIKANRMCPRERTATRIRETMRTTLNKKPHTEKVA